MVRTTNNSNQSPPRSREALAEVGLESPANKLNLIGDRKQIDKLNLINDEDVSESTPGKQWKVGKTGRRQDIKQGVLRSIVAGHAHYQLLKELNITFCFCINIIDLIEWNSIMLMPVKAALQCLFMLRFLWQLESKWQILQIMQF